MARARTSRTRRTPRRRGTGLGMGLSTRRAAVLALVVCALALTLAVPLRTYLGQRQELARTDAQRTQLRGEVTQLEQRRAELNDPAYVQAQARERLRYVKPGATPFQVQLPGGGQQASAAPSTNTGGGPWYSTLWSSVNEPAPRR